MSNDLLHKYELFVEDSCIHRDVTYPFLGLAGETGEVMEQVKKAWRDKGTEWTTHERRCNRVYDELSDVLWYLTRCLHVLDYDLEDLMEYNMKKLTERMNAE